MPEREMTQEEISATVAKLQAEAEQAMTAAEKNRAEAKNLDVLTANGEMILKQNALEVESSKVHLEVEKIQHAQMLREEKTFLAAPYNNNRFVYEYPIDDKHVSFAIDHLNGISHSNPNCEIELIINSPGGSIMAGNALIDFIAELKIRGHKITTIALGVAASMGAVLLQAGDTRIMGANSMLMIHEGSLGVGGSLGEVEDSVKMVEKLINQIFDLLASRATPLNPKTTAKWLRAQAKRKDIWYTSREAVELGLADKVR